MDYNQRKLKLLEFLSKRGIQDSSSLAEAIAGSQDLDMDVHALRMALMRYFKQGLLRRERVQGKFRYELTERGLQRMRWLQEQMKP